MCSGSLIFYQGAFEAFGFRRSDFEGHGFVLKSQLQLILAHISIDAYQIG